VNACAPIQPNDDGEQAAPDGGTRERQCAGRLSATTSATTNENADDFAAAGATSAAHGPATIDGQRNYDRPCRRVGRGSMVYPAENAARAAGPNRHR